MFILNTFLRSLGHTVQDVQDVRSRVVSALSRFGPESFRSLVVSAWVVSVLGRFGLGRFGPGSFRPNLVGRFGLIFSKSP